MPFANYSNKKIIFTNNKKKLFITFKINIHLISSNFNYQQRDVMYVHTGLRFIVGDQNAFSI